MSETYNVDLLMQVREKIVNEPEKHDQTRWATSTDGVCGTAYCVAGWVAALNGCEFKWLQFGDYDYRTAALATGELIEDYAIAALGLSGADEGWALFGVSNSRDDVLAKLDRLIEAGKNGERIPEGEL